jgi:hypothetical protein
MPHGAVQRVSWIIIQNRIHRTYAPRSLGFEYMRIVNIDVTVENFTK